MTSAIVVRICGLGMVTSLGTDSLTACAAARAGLSRSAMLENFRLRSEVAGTEEEVVGHRVDLLTRGFEGEPRLTRLLQGALADLLSVNNSIRWTELRHGFYLSVPDPRRTGQGTALMDDEVAREAYAAASAGDKPADPELIARAMGTRILARAASASGWPAVAELSFCSVGGHAGGIRALEAAKQDLQRGAVEVAVVVGVDSHIDEKTLDWLHASGRLKCDGMPVGLQPGEAAAALALSADSSDPGGRRQPPVVLEDVAIGHEGRDFFSGAVAYGEELARVLSSVWKPEYTTMPWILTDQNGEVYRATDWGHAAVRLRALFPAFATTELWYPALAFGDTGAASSLVAVGVAARAWARHYAPSRRAVVLSASDSGARAALALSSPAE